MAIELATAYVSLSTSAKGLRKEIDKEIGGVESGAQKRGRGIGGKLAGGIAVAAKAGLATAGAAAAAGFGTALVKGFGRLKAIEAAEAKLTGLGHSAETVERIMANATAAVTGTAFGLGDAASAAASAVASGVKPGKDLERTLKLVGDASAIAGTDFNDMAAIFNKISAGGVIQGEELAQLGDRGIPILQLLGEEMGVTAQEVRKLASEGKVDFETFQSAIESGMGGAALESGKTFQGAMNNVGAALGRLGANLLGGVFPKIAPMLQGVIKWLDSLMPVAEKVGQAIGDAMTWAGDAVKGLFDLVVRGDFTGAFRKAFGLEEDSAVVGFLFTLRDTFVSVFDEIKGGLRAFAAAWVYNDGEITSSGFPGVMERIGYAARQAFDYIRDTAIPAVQGFIEQFRNGEGAGGKFRDVLAYLYDQGKLAFTWFRDEGLPALAAVWDFVANTLAPDVRSAFLDRIWPAVVEVAQMFKRSWEVVIKPALSALWTFVRDVLGPFLVAFYHDGVKPTFDLIGKAISGAWENVIKPAWKAKQDALAGLIEFFRTAKDRITGAWDTLSTNIDRGWQVIKGTFRLFKEGLSDLKNRFVAVRDGIRDAWRGLGNIIARPINAVIDKVNSFLSGLKSALNQIPGVALTGNWSIRKIILDTSNATVGGGSRVALAAGGRVPGYSPSDRADNIPAMLTAGEYVLPVGATRSLASRFGPGFLEALRRGLPGFASGGRVGGPMGGAFDRGMGWLADFYRDIKGWVRDKFDLMPDLGGSWAGMAAKGALMSIREKLGSWVEANSGGPNAPMTGGQRVNYGGPYGWSPSGMGWQTIWALIKAVAPEARMTSNYRPGAVTASGIPSLHGMGRAVDVVSGDMAATFRKILPILKWSQLYYSPMGGAQIGYRDAAVHRLHFDHIHAALADGGLVKPFVADSGVTLGRGLNLLDNRTGGPEPLGRLDKPIRLDDYTISRLAVAFQDGAGAAVGGHQSRLDYLARSG